MGSVRVRANINGRSRRCAGGVSFGEGWHHIFAERPPRGGSARGAGADSVGPADCRGYYPE